MPEAAGWYRRSGDGTGITRQWDGSGWIGEAVVIPTGPQHFSDARPSSITRELISTVNQSMLDFQTSTSDGELSAHAEYELVSTEPSAPPSARYLASTRHRWAARLLDFVFRGVAYLLYSLPAIIAGLAARQDLPADASDAQRSAAWTDQFDYQERYWVLSVLLIWALELLLVVWKGGTIGKLLLGLRITDAASLHTPPSWVQAALRSANGLIPLMALVVPGRASELVLIGIGLASVILMIRDRRNRTVMDRLAMTLVVRRDARGR